MRAWNGSLKFNNKIRKSGARLWRERKCICYRWCDCRTSTRLWRERKCICYRWCDCRKSQIQHNKTPQLQSQVLPSGNIASGAKTSSMQKDPFAADNASLEWFTKIQQQNS